MKKSIISLVLALVMVFSLVLVAAPQAQATTHTDHCVCGGKAVGMPEHTCETATAWIELTTSVLEAGDYALDAGNYYLGGNLEIEKRITIVEGKTVTICLNGYTLSNSQPGGAMAKTDDNMRVFNLNKTGVTLNVCDCSADNTGAITSDSAKQGSIVFQRKAGLHRLPAETRFHHLQPVRRHPVLLRCCYQPRRSDPSVCGRG